MKSSVMKSSLNSDPLHSTSLLRNENRNCDYQNKHPKHPLLAPTVQFVRDPAGFYAERLNTSMAGAGTDDVSLIRIVVSRCEVGTGYFLEGDFSMCSGHNICREMGRFLY